jgi:hypothetical protein
MNFNASPLFRSPVAFKIENLYQENYTCCEKNSQQQNEQVFFLLLDKRDL